MELKITSKHRGKIPISDAVPFIVYVFPEHVIPYANISPIISI